MQLAALLKLHLTIHRLSISEHLLLKDYTTRFLDGVQKKKILSQGFYELDSSGNVMFYWYLTHLLAGYLFLFVILVTIFC